MDYEIIHKLSPEQEELAKKKAELNAFEKEYMRTIGVRYTELDRIEAQIEEYIALLESGQDFKPSPELKKLYREVAKKIHPDLATDDEERQRRQELMAKVNIAYENGNLEQLRSILRDWENSPESVKGEGISFELIRIIRQIAQSRDRLKAIQLEISALEQTELFQLKTKVIEAKEVGQDLLADMADELDKQINSAIAKLKELKVKLKL